MINSQFQKDALAYRREARDMTKAGYERVGEGGGLLWQLERGCRIGHKIVDVRIALRGTSVWCKIEKV